MMTELDWRQGKLLLHLTTIINMGMRNIVQWPASSKHDNLFISQPKNTNYDQIPDLWSGPCCHIPFYVSNKVCSLQECMIYFSSLFVTVIITFIIHCIYTKYVDFILYHFWLLVSVKRPVFNTNFVTSVSSLIFWFLPKYNIHKLLHCTMMLFAVMALLMLNQVAW